VTRRSREWRWCRIERAPHTSRPAKVERLLEVLREEGLDVLVELDLVGQVADSLRLVQE